MLVTAILVSALSLAASIAPASADTTTVWSTTSKSSNVKLNDQAKTATNADGTTTAVVWNVRTSSETSKLYAKIYNGGTWSTNELVADFPYDDWVSFNVQVAASGRVYIGASNSDYPLTVYIRTAVNTWSTTIVDNSGDWSIGAWAVGGSTNGSVVTFTDQLKATEPTAKLRSWSIDDSDSQSVWSYQLVHDFAANGGDFNNCVQKSRYYASCELDIQPAQVFTLADGSQLLLVQATRWSSNTDLPGTQYRLFKAHRDSISSAWTWDGSFGSMVPASKDSTYAYFAYPAAVLPSGSWAIALTTGTTSTVFNTIKLFTAPNFSTTPTASDSGYLQGLRGTDNPALLAKDSSIYMGFENNGKHYVGTVGSLSSTKVRLSNVTADQDIKQLLNWNGKVTAIITKSKTATYRSSLVNGSWTSQTRILSTAAYSSPVATFGLATQGFLLTTAPRLSGYRQIGLDVNITLTNNG